MDEGKLEPRVYEVGAHGAYDLSLSKEKKSWPLPGSPRARPWVKPRDEWLVVAMLLLLGLLLLLLGGVLWEWLRRPWVVRIGVLASAAVVVVLFFVARADHRDSDGEPFVWFEGISAWPTQFLRLVAVLLTIWFCADIWSRMTANTKHIKEEFFPPVDGKSEPSGGLARGWVQRVFLPCWKPVKPGKHTNKADFLWYEYVQCRSLRYRVSRVSVIGLVYFLGFLCLFILLGSPMSPTRGNLSADVNRLAIIVSAASMAVLVFVVHDVTQLCDRFTQLLFGDEHAVTWPAHVQTRFAREYDQKGEDIDDWLSIQVIARHTSVVDKTIYYPFTVLLVLLVSRHPLFDNWDWPVPLIAVFSFLLLIAVWSAALLRFSAKRARRRVVARIRKRISQAKQRFEAGQAARLEALVNDIENIRTGVFSPFQKNPVIAAILIPSGGMGTLAVIDLLARHL